MRSLLFGIARAADVHFASGAREVYPQVGRVAMLAAGEQRLLEEGRFGAAELRLEGGSLYVNNLRYFNRGTEIRALASIDDVWRWIRLRWLSVFGRRRPA